MEAGWFILKLLLSFLIGGLYIAFVIRVSERVNASMGGVLAGMPSTVLVSTFFIWWAAGTESVLSAIPVMIVGVGTSALFLTVFLHRYWGKRSVAFLVGVICWLLPLLYVVWNRQGLIISTTLALCCLIPSFIYFHRFPNRKLSDHIELSQRELLFRVCFAGGIISLAVLFSRLGGGELGGLIAGFPATSLSGLILVIRKHGINFAISMARGVSYGMVGNIGFLAILLLIMPLTGLLLGILISLSFSFVAAFFMYSLFLKEK